MGCVPTIHADRFPQQRPYVGKRVNVCFHYDHSARIMGTIIRWDAEGPGETILQLDNGWVVRGNECQFSLPATKEAV